MLPNFKLADEPVQAVFGDAEVKISQEGISVKQISTDLPPKAVKLFRFREGNFQPLLGVRSPSPFSTVCRCLTILLGLFALSSNLLFFQFTKAIQVILAKLPEVGLPILPDLR